MKYCKLPFFPDLPLNYAESQHDYNRSLDYLKRSQAIQQAIGDIAGLCETMFQIGKNYFLQNDFSNAELFWIKVYKLARKFKITQSLHDLKSLAADIGLQGGLDGWEQLSKQMGGDKGSGGVISQQKEFVAPAAAVVGNQEQGGRMFRKVRKFFGF